MDETGFNLGKKRIYGRSKRGTRVVDYRPYYRGENITIISALSSLRVAWPKGQGILGTMTLNGSISWCAFPRRGSLAGVAPLNNQGFLTYIKQVLAPSLWPGAVVIMDNLPTQKSQKIVEILSTVGATIFFLYPYCPDFNPIEKFWFILKDYLRSLVPMTRDELEEGLVDVIL
ncbi:transposase [Moorena sp. SIO3I6]|uniref:transposase n=1 Tax=Moorena sp. SIO3I6 TaxID=2607831 RepID=UPI0013F7D539|nr:transposase [Moorena sp. SIO3I6]NEP27989.1 transposase [Moorena sp. SIO3I6]